MIAMTPEQRLERRRTRKREWIRRRRAADKANPEAYARARAQWSVWNRASKERLKKNPQAYERYRQNIRDWQSRHPERMSELHRAERQRVREDVFNAYGRACACCGITEPAFLTIDHIHGGGRRHRAAVKRGLYRWLRQQGFPDGYRTLCWNCNAATHFQGSCPHAS